MPRVSRLNCSVSDGVYHVISRTAIESHFSDFEKDHLLKTIKHFSRIYFTKVYGYSVMGNHFHLIVQMQDSSCICESNFKKRYQLYKKSLAYDPRFQLDNEEHVQAMKKKWGSLSEFVRDIKLSFTRWYNVRHHRRGFLWGGRFKNVLLEKGYPLVNCMAYVDLNPVRANICETPEQYRWCSLYEHAIRKNKDHWLCLDYFENSIGDFQGLKSKRDRLLFYRKFLYVQGKEGTHKMQKGKVQALNKIPKNKYKKAEKKEFHYGFKEQFLLQSRYFTDSLIIGSQEFVRVIHSQYKGRLFEKRKRKFPPVKGFSGIYSMRELRKNNWAA